MRASSGLVVGGLGAAAIVLLGCRAEPVVVEPDAAAVGVDPATEVERPGEWVVDYGDQTLLVHADPALGGEVERLLLLFGDLLAESVPITEQTRLPIGWTTLSFVADHGRLVVEEPDYPNDPEANTRPDVSASLATLARQRAVLQQAGVAGEAIDFDQHVLTITGVLERDELMLVRVESPGGRMTGWRLTPAEGIEEADEVESLPVHVIFNARPELLDAMLLPAGFLALFAGGRLTTIVNEANEIVWDWASDGDLPRDRASDLGSSIGGGEFVPRPRPRPLLEPLD
ncbi:hypothetical protein DB30_00445 [Enhygromyxa salina]|uniref:Imm33-like domain-containing protein n=1 Tax=Enhygromyxa salina TaxID=215803 RepID=A0A0C2CZF3_9BACT|nr:hypothetical protein [Enhygromyxa salina]KIG13222.1 hypothetical protein DB30_00445 [Enhygromyxa salina]